MLHKSKKEFLMTADLGAWKLLGQQPTFRELASMLFVLLTSTN